MAKSTLIGKIIGCRELEPNDVYKKAALAVRMDAGYYTDAEVNAPVKCIAEYKVRDPEQIEAIAMQYSKRCKEGKQMRIKLRNVKTMMAKSSKTKQALPIVNGMRNWDVVQKNKYKPVEIEEVKPFAIKPSVKLMD